MNLSRRRFLQASATSLMASTLPMPAQEAAKTRKLRKAVMLGTVKLKTDSLSEKFKAIKAAGFDGVEPNGNMNNQEVLEALKESGLECASVCCHSHWKDTLTHTDPAVRKKGIEGLIITLKDAKTYGADSVLFVPGTVNAEVSYDTAYQRAQEGIREAIPIAKELGVRISVENVWNNFLLSPIEMARFIDEFDTPWVGSHFDIGNVLRSGWPEQWIKILGKRINRLHFKEFSTDKMMKEGLYKGFEVDFLEGSNNWKEIMTQLDGIGYQGWCIAEQRMGINPGDMAKLTTAMDKMFAM